MEDVFDVLVPYIFIAAAELVVISYGLEKFCKQLPLAKLREKRIKSPENMT